MGRIRIGTVGYLNSVPLTSHLDPERYEVVADHPRGISASLARGEVAVALAPVASVLSDGDFRILPGFCIGAEGRVHSVLLVAETPPERWTEVVLDGESRTSVVLAQLLLTQGPLSARVPSPLSVRTVAPGEAPALARGTTAAVVIGDAARHLPDRLTERLDLAEIWTQWTGKPFVFAVWATRPGLPSHVVDDLREAARLGLDALPEHFRGADLDYLTQSIRYDLDEAALIGLRRFAALGFRAGHLSTEHVAFLEPEPVVAGTPSEVEAALEAAVRGERLGEGPARVLATSPLSTLQTAAQLVRAGRHPADRATYSVAVARDARGAVGLDEVPAGASVYLHQLDTLGAADSSALVQRVAGRGLRPVAADLAAIATAAISSGGTPEQALAALAAAGLVGVVWRASDDVSHHLIDETARLGLSVLAVVEARPEVLVDQLSRVRSAADATAAIGAVEVILELPEGSLVEPGCPTTATWLRGVALTRLFLEDVEHVVASPAHVGVAACQVALFGGADDLGLVGVSSRSRAEATAEVEEAERALRVVGLEAVRRDPAFHTLREPLTRLRKVRRPEERA